MSRKLSYSFLVFVTGLFVSASPYAAAESPSPHDHNMHYMRDGMHKHCEHHHGRGMRAMLKQLDLSEEQRGRIDAVSQELKPQFKEKWTALRNVSKQLSALGMSDNYDESRVNDLADKKGDITAELEKLKAVKATRIYAVLTPEQREKLVGWRHKKQVMESPL